MTTFMTLFISVSILLFVPVFFGSQRDDGLRHVDFMAGDEGED